MTDSHPYRESPHSRVGNCECGMAEESAAHHHAYVKASANDRCICSKPADAPIHTGATQ